MNISVVIPAYNEEKAIDMTIAGIKSALKELGITHEIIVVDDGSQDKTGEIAISKGARVITHALNKGYGASLKRGIAASSYDYILMVDADGTYPLNQVSLLFKCLNGCDMVVGARTGANVNIPFLRRAAKTILNLLANYLSGVKIPDLNSGFRIIKKEAVNKFLYILPDGFSFTTTITLALLVNNYNVAYVAIDYHKRKGRSKFHPIKDTANYFQLIVRTIIYFNPLKIFLPISLILFLFGLGILLYSYFFMKRVMDVATVLCITTAIQIGAMGLLADLIDKRLQK